MFEQSALYAASQLLCSRTQRRPGRRRRRCRAFPSATRSPGLVTQASFVLQAPAGNNSGVTNGSASVPFNTTLVFDAGLDAQAAERVAVRAEPGQCPPGAGNADQSGRLHVVQRRQRRRRDQQQPRHHARTPATGAASSSATTTKPMPSQQVTVPGRRHPGRAQRRRGRLRRVGRDVDPELHQHPLCRRRRPAGLEQLLSAITLFNSRPTITNDNIANTGGTGGTEAAIGADLDSFREDDTARGPLIRKVTVTTTA